MIGMGICPTIAFLRMHGDCTRQANPADAQQSDSAESNEVESDNKVEWTIVDFQVRSSWASLVALTRLSLDECVSHPAAVELTLTCIVVLVSSLCLFMDNYYIWDGKRPTYYL